MKSLRSTLILLAIVAALGGYIYFNERGPIAESGAAVLLRSDPQQVSQVTLSRQGNVVALKKEGTHWMVSDAKTPRPVLADGEAVKSLLTELQLIQAPSSLPDDAKNRKEFGLEKPDSSVQIGAAKIEFGTAPSFDATKIYARVTNEGKSQVALLPNSLSVNAAKPLADWRDQAALRITLDEAQKVTLNAPMVAASFEKTKAGEDGSPTEWNMTAPASAKADGGTLESLIGQLPITKAVKFIDNDPKSLAAWNLDKPLAQVEITTPEGPRSLLIGKKVGNNYAAKNSMSPAVFELPSSFFSLLNRPPRDWRDKKIVEAEIEKLQQVDATFSGATKTFTKKTDKWSDSSVKSDGSAAAQKAADATNRDLMDLLYAVQGLNAGDFIDKPAAPTTYGFDKPWLDLKMDATRLQIGKVGDKYYARTGSGSEFKGSVFQLTLGAHIGVQKPLGLLFAATKK